jgi:hypothetical protein
MIERPAPAGAGIAQAGAEASEAARAAPVPQVNAADPAAPGTPAEGMSHVLAASGPEPALAQAPPRFADRGSARFESAATRSALRRATRVATGVETMKYRAVFACCTEATDTPIK